MKEKDNHPANEEKDNVIFLDSYKKYESGDVLPEAEKNVKAAPMYVVKGDLKKKPDNLQDKRREVFLRIIK